MSACHWERTRVLQRVHEIQRQLDTAQRGQRPAAATVIERLQRELLQASEALADLPDCSE